MSRISTSAASTAAAPASGSRASSSSTESGRAAANSAASSSWARGLTADLDRREWPILPDRQDAALRELEQRDERGQDFDDRGAFPDHLEPTERLAPRQ